MTPEECGEYYMKTGNIPPVTMLTWVSVYNILVSAGYGNAT